MTLEPLLVAMSVVLPALAAFTAIEIVRRLRDDAAEIAWFLLAALVLGAGVWAGDFIGLLALRIGTPVSYDLGLNALALLVAVAAAVVTLYVLSLRAASQMTRLAFVLFAAAGFAATHFVEMAALRLDGVVRFEARGPVLAVLLAAVLLRLALALYDPTGAWRGRLPVLARVAAVALPVGVAGPAAHYVAMLATSRLRAPA